MNTRTFFDSALDDGPQVEVYICADRTGIVFKEEDSKQRTGDMVGVAVSEIDDLVAHLQALKIKIEAGE